MGAHEGVAALPVELAVHLVPHRGQRAVTADGVPHVLALLADVGHRQPGEDAGVVGLPPAGGVEGGAVEGEPATLRVDRDHRGVERAERCVPQVQQLGGHGTDSARTGGRGTSGGGSSYASRVLRRALPLAALVLVGAGCTTGGTSISASRSTLATTTTTTPPRGNVDGILRIGALLPTTGVGATLGASLLAGLQLAVAEINQAGGVNDQPVELVVADEAGDPAQASVALERMVEQDLVDAVVGPVSTRVTLSLLGELTSAGIVSCSPTNTASSLSEYPDQGYYFRTAPPDSLQAVALGRSIAETGAKSAAILFVDDDYGRSITEGLVNELRRQGTEVTARVSIDPTAASYEADAAGRCSTRTPMPSPSPGSPTRACGCSRRCTTWVSGPTVSRCSSATACGRSTSAPHSAPLSRRRPPASGGCRWPRAS